MQFQNGNIFAISLGRKEDVHLIESPTGQQSGGCHGHFESLIYIHAVGRQARSCCTHALRGPELKLTRAIVFLLFVCFIFGDGLCAIKFV